MKGEYLSEIIDINNIKSGFNLIYAPCGSGKTTFAKTKLKQLNDNIFGIDTLYLIDGSMAKEQLLRSDDAIYEENRWTDEPQWRLPGITVMTYAGYSVLTEKAPKYDGWCEDAIIIYDELHNEITWSKWQKENNQHKKAIELIHQRIKTGNNTVIAMSATPENIRNEFKYCLYEVKLNGEPRHYETQNIIQYSNLSIIIDNIEPSQKGIVYIPRITEMLKYKQMLDVKGFKTAALWSTNNKDHTLTEEQLKIREYIIDHRELPEYVDILFVNSCFETSISIGNENKTKRPLDFMIIHTTKTDAQIQARGRYRNDLENLYLHQNDSNDVITLSNKWIYKKLYKDDKTNLCVELGYKDKNGRLLKWPTIKEKLEKNDYIINEDRTSRERYSIIKPLW